MYENSKIYLTNNQNNEQEMMLIQNENNNNDEEEEYDENNEKDKNPLKNLGKNIIYKNKYIFGIKENLYDLVSLTLYFLIIYVLFI